MYHINIRWIRQMSEWTTFPVSSSEFSKVPDNDFIIPEYFDLTLLPIFKQLFAYCCSICQNNIKGHRWRFVSLAKAPLPTFLCLKQPLNLLCPGEKYNKRLARLGKERLNQVLTYKCLLLSVQRQRWRNILKSRPKTSLATAIFQKVLLGLQKCRVVFICCWHWLTIYHLERCYHFWRSHVESSRAALLVFEKKELE